MPWNYASAPTMPCIIWGHRKLRTLLNRCAPCMSGFTLGFLQEHCNTERA